MKTLIITLALSLSPLVPTTSPQEPEPCTCIGIPPLCSPGAEPICLCEYEGSLRCLWVCGSVEPS